VSARASRILNLYIKQKIDFRIFVKTTLHPNLSLLKPNTV
jgi:hypothetical protein